MNEINQAEKGWKSISVRGNSVYEGFVVGRSVAQVMGMKGGQWDLGRLEQRA